MSLWLLLKRRGPRATLTRAWSSTIILSIICIHTKTYLHLGFLRLPSSFFARFFLKTCWNTSKSLFLISWGLLREALRRQNERRSRWASAWLRRSRAAILSKIYCFGASRWKRRTTGPSVSNLFSFFLPLPISSILFQGSKSQDALLTFLLNGLWIYSLECCLQPDYINNYRGMWRFWG